MFNADQKINHEMKVRHPSLKVFFLLIALAVLPAVIADFFTKPEEDSGKYLTAFILFIEIHLVLIFLFLRHVFLMLRMGGETDATRFLKIKTTLLLLLTGAVIFFLFNYLNSF